MGRQRLAENLLAGFEDRFFGSRRGDAIVGQDLNTPFGQDLLGEDREPLVHFRQDVILGMHQHAAHGLISQARVIQLHALDEVIELGHQLDARKSAARHHERQQLLAHQGVGFDIGLFQHLNQVIPQGQRVGQRAEGLAVLDHAGHAEKVRDAAECDHQVVVGQLELARAEAGADGDHLAGQVDGFHFAHDQLRVRAQVADGRYDVGQSDRAADDFGKHGLIDPVILLVHQLNGGFAGLQDFLQAAGHINSREAPAQNQDFFRHRLYFE